MNELNQLVETSSMRAPPQSKLHTHLKTNKSVLFFNIAC